MACSIVPAMTTHELGVLGCGPMGGAIVHGAITSGALQRCDVLAVDRDADARSAMAALGCVVSDDIRDLESCPRLLLAVRPQDFADIGAALQADKDRLAISVMAGLTSEGIAAVMGAATRVVRTMPSTAASIGKAVTAVAAGPGATQDDLDWASTLMASVGSTVIVDEAQMHAVTAVSGSGPAWVYLLAEAVQAQGAALGLSDDQLKLLVPSMVSGAAALLEADGRDPAALREAVTTPGGTTEAGLAAMREAGFIEAVHAGVRAACARGKALS